MNPYLPEKNDEFIGRSIELGQLAEVSDLAEAAIVVVYGRRRVGKTELIEQAWRERRLLKFEGIEGQDEAYQMRSVLGQLARYTGEYWHGRVKADTWAGVFELLAGITKQGCWTIYFEELQWLANYETRFVAELKYFWDNFFRYNPELRVVLCGSSPSFMVNKVIKSKALYNRSQYTIALNEFSIQEAKQFLGSRFSPTDAMDAYLAVGGIPEYLKYIRRGSSVYLSLCQHCFRKESFFAGEWDKIFISSFSEKPEYKKIVSFLAQQKFASREEILKFLGASSGGSISALLEDLQLCGFVECYSPFNAKANSRLNRYCLADNYMHLYASFIQPRLQQIVRGEYDLDPLAALNIATYRQWQGYAFERFCRHYHRKISELLGFRAVRYRSGAFFNRSTKKTDPGFQFDLVFERADKTITLCEIKYSEYPASVQVGRVFAEKVERFPVAPQLRTERVLISAAGATGELLNGGYFDQIVTLEELIG